MRAAVNRLGLIIYSLRIAGDQTFKQRPFDEAAITELCRRGIYFSSNKIITLKN